MALMRVWAPRAKKVELESGGRRDAMEAEARGWWRLDAPWVKHGSTYGFRLDGAEPLPDPRSGWQPEGALGLSAWVDHGLFAWQDHNWQPPDFNHAVFYELHVGTFSAEGTFEAVIPRLGHLVDLGLTHIEIMPVGQFPGRHGWGYDVAQPYAPQHSYGGPEGLKRLVNAAHAKGLAMVLDVVYNHLGPEGNVLDRYGPYFTDRYKGPWGPAMNYDGRASREVRQFVAGNARMWLRDYHFDGLRLDAVHGIFDNSAVHILEELARAALELEEQLGRPLRLVAESDLNDPRLLWPPELGGYGLAAQWDDDFQHSLHALLTGEKRAHFLDFGKLAHLAKALRSGYVYDGQYSEARERDFGRPATGLPAQAFVAFLQNHDQAGNRPGGERSSHYLSVPQLKLAAAVVLLGPFLPLLFAGEEWGARTPFKFFTDFQDPALDQAVTEGRRREFGAFTRPDQEERPQALETFLESKLDWEEAGRLPHAELLAWHQSLLLLRRQLPLPAPTAWTQMPLEFDEAQGWLWFRRGPLLLACNFNPEPRAIPWAGGDVGALALASAPGAQALPQELRLPGHGAAVWKLEGHPHQPPA
jgi:maltooligosyltrehalose trehalohydrolase